jgi:hypothetical protein
MFIPDDAEILIADPESGGYSKLQEDGVTYIADQSYAEYTGLPIGAIAIAVPEEWESQRYEG